MSKDFDRLLKKANRLYLENFPKSCWFGRCVFLSWYCGLGTCKFCFRSTIKHKVKFAEKAKRTKWSILSDAVIGKVMGWRLEFLTGGYQIFSFAEMQEIVQMVAGVYGEKIWINLGVLEKRELEQLKPYVEGVCASIETVEEGLHDRVCPDKPIKPYAEMLKVAGKKGFKKSITIVVGLGEKKKDFELLAKFIEEHKLDRITFYALKPVKGTEFTTSPTVEDYAWWIAQTRIHFPKLEIIAGLTPKRADYVEMLLKAGVNGITKFPAIREFGSREAKLIEKQVKKGRREFKGSLVKFPRVDWAEKVKELGLDGRVLEKVLENVKNMEKNINERWRES